MSRRRVLVRLRGRRRSGSLTLVRGRYIGVRRGSARSFFDSTYVPTDIHIDCIFTSVPGNNANLVSRNGHQRAVEQTMEHTVAWVALMPRFCPSPLLAPADPGLLVQPPLGSPPPCSPPPFAPFSFAATSSFSVRRAASHGGRRHNDDQTSNLKLLTES